MWPILWLYPAWGLWSLAECPDCLCLYHRPPPQLPQKSPSKKNKRKNRSENFGRSHSCHVVAWHWWPRFALNLLNCTMARKPTIYSTGAAWCPTCPLDPAWKPLCAQSHWWSLLRNRFGIEVTAQSQWLKSLFELAELSYEEPCSAAHHSSLLCAWTCTCAGICTWLIYEFYVKWMNMQTFVEAHKCAGGHALHMHNSKACGSHIQGGPLWLYWKCGLPAMSAWKANAGVALAELQKKEQDRLTKCSALQWGWQSCLGICLHVHAARLCTRVYPIWAKMYAWSASARTCVYTRYQGNMIRPLSNIGERKDNKIWYKCAITHGQTWLVAGTQSPLLWYLSSMIKLPASQAKLRMPCLGSRGSKCSEYLDLSLTTYIYIYIDKDFTLWRYRRSTV